jgi:hypothetical protein
VINPTILVVPEERDKPAIILDREQVKIVTGAYLTQDNLIANASVPATLATSTLPVGTAMYNTL